MYNLTYFLTQRFLPHMIFNDTPSRKQAHFLDQYFPNFLVIGTLWTIYRFARVPPKFSHIFGCEAQLALMHNLFSIARQPITFLLSFLKTLKLIILTFILSFTPWQIS